MRQLRVTAAALLGFCCMAAPALAQDFDCSKQDTLPQMGLTWCAGQDFEKADAELNALWPKVRAALKEQDDELKDIDPNYPGAEAALLKAQRAWIDYRDGSCELAGFEARGGSMEPMLVAACLADMTQKRTDELKDFLNSDGQ